MYQGPRAVKFIDAESRMMNARRWGSVGMGVSNTGRVWEHDILEMDGGDHCH